MIDYPGIYEFTDLVDVPHTYIGSNGKVLSVNPSETALIFTTAGTGGSGGLNIETPSGTVDGVNTSFVATVTPLYIIIDGVTYFQGQGYSLAGLNITTDIAPVGFIRSVENTSGVTVETPTGIINGSNVTFTVSNTPKYVISDGVTYFVNNGYTLSGLTVTMDIAPVGFIKSVY